MNNTPPVPAVEPTPAGYTLARAVADIDRLEAENARLRDELAVQTKAATDEIRQLVPTYINELTAERDRYREIVGNVVRWCFSGIEPRSPEHPAWSLVGAVTGIGANNEQAARDLCREFGVDADTGELT